MWTLLRNRHLRQALRIRWNHFVTLHVLASTADVVIEQRCLSLFGHVARFRLYQNMAQPVLKLLWYLPQSASMRCGRSNRTAWVSCGTMLNFDKVLIFLRLLSSTSSSTTPSRCSARWNHKGVRVLRLCSKSRTARQPWTPALANSPSIAWEA